MKVVRAVLRQRDEMIVDQVSSQVISLESSMVPHAGVILNNFELHQVWKKKTFEKYEKNIMFVVGHDIKLFHLFVDFTRRPF